MQDNDAQAIAEDMEDGTYYRTARGWYSTLFHTPIAERSYFIIVIILALINSYFAIASFIRIFPITTNVFFVTYSRDVWEDLPRINRIAVNSGEDKNVAVMRFLVNSYVTNRESYDLKLYEMRGYNIRSQSTKEVFEEYRKSIDATNPYSPYRLYTTKARRLVDVQSFDYKCSEDSCQARVIFNGAVRSLATGGEISRSKLQANITYKYTKFVVDQSLDKVDWVARVFGLTGNALRVSGEKRKVVPMTFLVSDYKVKELLE